MRTGGISLAMTPNAMISVRPRMGSDVGVKPYVGGQGIRRRPGRQTARHRPVKPGPDIALAPRTRCAHER